LRKNQKQHYVYIPSDLQNEVPKDADGRCTLIEIPLQLLFYVEVYITDILFPSSLANPTKSLVVEITGYFF
jgi:hypothetical protein